MWLNGFRGIMAGSGASSAASSSSSCVGAWWVPVCARRCCRIQRAEGARTAKIYIYGTDCWGKGSNLVCCVLSSSVVLEHGTTGSSSDPISRPVVFDGSSDSKVHEHKFFSRMSC
jgi:hypothetical protein